VEIRKPRADDRSAIESRESFHSFDKGWIGGYSFSVSPSLYSVRRLHRQWQVANGGAGRSHCECQSTAACTAECKSDVDRQAGVALVAAEGTGREVFLFHDDTGFAAPKEEFRMKTKERYL
jgi:hypothetical protein